MGFNVPNCEPQPNDDPNADINQLESCQMETFCARLLEERQRLGLKQADLAGQAGVARTTYLHYESGDRAATVPFLLGLIEAGIDVPYLLTGKRQLLDMTPAESALLLKFRAAPPELQAALATVVAAVGGKGKQADH